MIGDVTMTLQQIAILAGSIMSVIGLASWIVTRVLNLIKLTTEPLRKIEGDVRRNNAGIIAVLKFAINRAHQDFINTGKIDKMELHNILDIHRQLQALMMHGDSYIDELISDITGNRKYVGIPTPNSESDKNVDR